MRTPSIISVFLLLLANQVCLAAAPTVYNLGVAKTDITGPFVASSTGYNSPGDEMAGLAMRLYSRAFVIEQPGGETVAIVVTDQLHMYQSIKLGVVKKLSDAGYGDVFNNDNVMLSATHTHSATSNTSWYTLFNLFNGVIGFDKLNYEVVVRGITKSILEAYEKRKPGTLGYGEIQVPGGSHNRSLLAYLKNVDADQFTTSVDETLRMVRFDSIAGEPLGLVNWYAVHGTSLGITNTVIHGDNKGWAAYRFEQTMGGNFVAAFAQGAMGDSSPNIPNPDDVRLAFSRPNDLNPTLDPLENPIVAGNIQFDAAYALYPNATAPLTGPVDFRHSFINFNHVALNPHYIGNFKKPYDTDADSNATTCTAIIGGGFLAGDEEGAPVAFAAEGDIRHAITMIDGEISIDEYSFNEINDATLSGLLGGIWPLAEQVLGEEIYDPCHKEKVNILPVGNVDNFWIPNRDVPFVPVEIPLQIFRIGDFGVMGTPFEMTTMTGRRIQAATSASLASAGITKVALAGMVNSYGQYLATREEYAEQHFEGAFTIYGPWASSAVAQELDRLAADIATGTPSQTDPMPLDLSDSQVIETWISARGVVTDGGNFGAALVNAASEYNAQDDEVVVAFRASHPRTILEKKMDGSLSRFYNPDTYTFFEIQKKVEGQWTTYATDTDPYTTFSWAREGGPSSLSDLSTATVRWLIRDQSPGIYRIKYNGLAKRFQLITTYESFTGFSAEFTLK